jgi:hypothetical protein
MQYWNPFEKGKWLVRTANYCRKEEAMVRLSRKAKPQIALRPHDDKNVMDSIRRNCRSLLAPLHDAGAGRRTMSENLKKVDVHYPPP